MKTKKVGNVIATRTRCGGEGYPVWFTYTAYEPTSEHEGPGVRINGQLVSDLTERCPPAGISAKAYNAFRAKNRAEARAALIKAFPADREDILVDFPFPEDRDEDAVNIFECQT